MVKQTKIKTPYNKNFSKNQMQKKCEANSL